MRLFPVLTLWCLLCSAVGAQQPCATNTDCADGNSCNGFELCQGGFCRPGAPVPDGQGCNAGNVCTNSDVCRGGICTPGVHRPDGAGCSDGNPCNGRETCQQGVCSPGPLAANGTACGDAEPCNGTDTCQTGVCVRGGVPAEGSPCSDGFICNGLEACRSGACTPAQPAPDGTSCGDGKSCNGAETCGGGICRSGTPPDCDDRDPCTTDGCDNTLGGCKHTPRVEGANCSDTNPCNGKETCQGGRCAWDGLPRPVLCEDANTCNGVEFCQNQQCVPGTRPPNGTSCADSNVCNGLERCQNGTCGAGSPLACGDTNPCSVESCDPREGCVYALLPNGTSCNDDGTVCNGVATCQGGSCNPGVAPACGALACDPIAGCVIDTRITGRKLLVRVRRGDVKVKVQTRNQIVTSAPAMAGTAADPVLHGGALRVRSASGGFDRSVALPRQGWEYVGDSDESRGFRYRERNRAAAIRSVVVKDGKIAKVVGGEGLALRTSLATDPDPIDISLVLGNQRYCMAFGGTTRFEAMRRFAAQDAPAPGACPP